MLITVERALFLSQVPMFVGMDEDALMRLASAARERKAHASEAIMQEGQMGRDMYILVEGKVRLHKGERELGIIGPRGVIGELGALDPHPRHASATALEETHLLRLDHITLLDELAVNNDLGRGIIRYLVGRLLECP